MLSATVNSSNSARLREVAGVPLAGPGCISRCVEGEADLLRTRRAIRKHKFSGSKSPLQISEGLRYDSGWYRESRGANAILQFRKRVVVAKAVLRNLSEKPVPSHFSSAWLLSADERWPLRTFSFFQENHNLSAIYLRACRSTRRWDVSTQPEASSSLHLCTAVKAAVEVEEPRLGFLCMCDSSALHPVHFHVLFDRSTS